jgi:predicted RNA-binding protein YlqC (UPF0109 family)
VNEPEVAFIHSIVSVLVTKIDQIKIERSIDERGVLLRLSVAPEDLGCVIGRRGATAQGMRSMLHTLGNKTGGRYSLQVVDESKAQA